MGIRRIKNDMNSGFVIEIFGYAIMVTFINIRMMANLFKAHGGSYDSMIQHQHKKHHHEHDHESEISTT